MNRRDFMNWMGVGAIATSLPVAIAACTPEATEETTATTPEATSAEPTSIAADFTAIGTTAELSEQGYLSDDSTFDEPVIVIQDPANAESLIALSAKCTHAGCAVAWQEDLFACPCHGSKFNPDGSVAEGPANAPLKAYAAKVEGDSVLVSAA